jgi:hypothetical protein
MNLILKTGKTGVGEAIGENCLKPFNGLRSGKDTAKDTITKQAKGHVITEIGGALRHEDK